MVDNNKNGVNDSLETLWIPLILIVISLIGSCVCEIKELDRTLDLFTGLLGGGLAALGFNPKNRT